MNFQECHEEPIHIPAHVQSYGYLIGLDAKEKIIRFYSENISTLFHIDEEIIGKKFEHFSDIFYHILNSPGYNNLSLRQKEGNKNLDKITLDGIDYHLTIYKYRGFVYIELERYVKSSVTRNLLYKSIEDVQSAKSEEEIWSELVRNMFKITGYERVLVYKFMSDGSGRVVAEEKLQHMESLMNLYYPESDIPAQARALYLLNYKRIFSNVHSKPVPIISCTKEVDLTYSNVRAMSPLHAQYVKNSGSSSSFSTSIIVDNKLWGLVTCHNTEPKHIDLHSRIEAEICTQIAANAYNSYKSRRILEEEALFLLKATQLKSKLLRQESLKKSLFKNVQDILEISNADGFAVVINDEVQQAGKAPKDKVTLNIARWARENLDTLLFSDNAFCRNYQTQIDGLGEECSGIAISFVGKDRTNVLLWFRKEFKEHIDWAGDPKKEIATQQFYDRERNAVSPRSSFKIFSEEIHGKSLYWSSEDLRIITKIHDTILEILQEQFERVYHLNRELSKVNEELDSFSHTISHDLATPLTVIKLNVQMLSKNNHDEKVRQKLSSILGEIDNMSEMMSNVLQLSRLKHSEYRLVEVPTTHMIEKITEDAKLTYHAHPEIHIGATPSVVGEKTLVYQIFQNIITNAVKYSSRQENPKINIEGEIEGDCVVYRISDNGIGIPEEEKDNVFKIFKRIDNAKSFAGSGVGLTIVQSIMKRLGGSIGFTSVVGEGTTFILKFHQPKETLSSDHPHL